MAGYHAQLKDLRPGDLVQVASEPVCSSILWKKGDRGRVVRNNESSKNMVVNFGGGIGQFTVGYRYVVPYGGGAPSAASHAGGAHGAYDAHGGSSAGMGGGDKIAENIKRLAESMKEHSMEPKATFNYADVCRRNELSRISFTTAVRSVPLRPALMGYEVGDIFSRFDTNNDGYVDLDEFCSTLKHAMSKPDADASPSRRRYAPHWGATPMSTDHGAPSGLDSHGAASRDAGGSGVSGGASWDRVGVHGGAHAAGGGAASGDYSHAAGAGAASGGHSHAAGGGGASGSYSYAAGAHGGGASGGHSHAAGGGGAGGSYSYAAGAHGGGASGGHSYAAGGGGAGGSYSYSYAAAGGGAGAHARSGGGGHSYGMHAGYGGYYYDEKEAARRKVFAPDRELDLSSTSISHPSGQLPAFGHGGYDWVRKGNGHQDRSLRQDAAHQTVTAYEHGGYVLDGKRIALEGIKEMMDGTRIVYASDPIPHGAHSQAHGATKWSVHPPGMLIDVASERALSGQRVAAVNAASAYHIGGGFCEGGRHALEESVCIQSTLYKSLVAAGEQAKSQHVTVPACARPRLNREGQPWHCHIPEDGVVLSPHVEVFRGGTFEGYPFLDKPASLAAVVSVSMPNCNDRMRDAPCDMPAEAEEYSAILCKKFKAVLSAAVQVGATELVLPDVGCGVYGNPPRDVGFAFGKVLREEFPSALAQIHLVGRDDFAEAAQAAASGKLTAPESTLHKDSHEEADEDEECKRVRVAFRRWDRDGDGTINRHELAAVLQKIDPGNWSDYRANMLLDAVDFNGDGLIQHEEFVTWLGLDHDRWVTARRSLADEAKIAS